MSEPISEAGGPFLLPLHCPYCGVRHIDKDEWATRKHHTHLCLNPECQKFFRVEPYTFGAPRLIIFDADGTLRKCTVPGQPCPNKDGEWELLPNVKERLTALATAGVKMSVASNQGGIGMGYISEEIVLHLLTDMMRVATGRSDYDRFIHICPHKPSAKCACRKPGPDMLVQAYMTQNVLPENALFVGDFETDKQAAEAAGVPFMWARDFFGW